MKKKRLRNRLRDEKSFPYIAVTVEDEYPRVMFTRERHRRVLIEAPRRFALRERPVPDPDASEVVVRIAATAVCHTDLGIYTYDAAQSLDTSLLVCDGLGAGSGGQPETCSKAMPAGTYYIVVDSFSPFYAPPNNVDPTDFKLVIVGS